MKCGALLLTTFVLSFISTSAYSAVSKAPKDVVILTVDSVIERISEQRALLDAEPDKVYDVINELITPNFDFFNMSKWILGKHWKAASAEQRRTFTAEFQTLLIRTYARALLGFTDEKVNYIETVYGKKPNIVMVKTEIKSTANENVTPINYTMYKVEDNWKVINVSFEGVSLVETYRKSFASEIRNNGLGSLIEKLAAKNRKPEQSPAR